MDFKEKIKGLKKTDKNQQQDKERILKNSKEYQELKVLKKIFKEAGYHGIIFTRNKPSDIYKNIKYDINKELTDQEIYVYAFGKNIRYDIEATIESYEYARKKHLETLELEKTLSTEKFQEKLKTINYLGWKKLLIKDIFTYENSYEAFKDITNVILEDIYSNKILSNNGETFIFKYSSLSWTKNKAIAICNLLNDEKNNKEIETKSLDVILNEFNPEKYTIVENENTKEKFQDKYILKFKNIIKK